MEPKPLGAELMKYHSIEFDLKLYIVHCNQALGEFKARVSEATDILT